MKDNREAPKGDIETLNGDGKEFMSLREALKIDGEALKGDVELKGNGEALRGNSEAFN